MSLAFDSATTLAQRLRNKELGSRELTELMIERIERFDPLVNAVVVRDFERGLEAADRADEAFARGADVGPLHGLPMTIKEAYDIEGLATTWGVPAFAKNIATSDAAVVRAFQNAGAHFIGKTNVPLQLADFQTYNDLYGTTSNPWNLERTPGGSSGGSSAALCAGLTPLESGSDIGGSIRNPAHYCGVYGHKPTYGVVPGDGHTLPGADAAPDIAVVGPMARSAEDLALSMRLVAGPDSFNEPGWRISLPPAQERALSDYRVAIWPSDPVCPVSTAVADRVQQLADRLARLGATVSDRARPDFTSGHSHEIYLQMLNGQLSSALPDTVYAVMVQGAEGLDPENRSNEAMALRATVQSHRDWVRASQARARLRKAWRSFFRDWDILLCPQMPTTAFRHDHSPFQGRTIDVDGDLRSYLSQIFWAGLITVSYLPSTVFPTGIADDGLPIGIQAVGAEFQDYTCIEFTRAMADEIGGFHPPAGF